MNKISKTDIERVKRLAFNLSKEIEGLNDEARLLFISVLINLFKAEILELNRRMAEIN